VEALAIPPLLRIAAVSATVAKATTPRGVNRFNSRGARPLTPGRGDPYESKISLGFSSRGQAHLSLAPFKGSQEQSQ